LLATTLDAATFKRERSPKALTTVKAGTIRSVMMVVTTPRAVMPGDGQATAAAYVPLSFAPGEAYQFDWSHEVVLLSGVTVIVKVAHVRLCHSRMLFVRA
jgi:hypothetical protein